MADKGTPVIYFLRMAIHTYAATVQRNVSVIMEPWSAERYLAANLLLVQSKEEREAATVWMVTMVMVSHATDQVR